MPKKTEVVKPLGRKPTHNLHVIIPGRLEKALKKRAEADGLRQSAVVVMALNSYLEEKHGTKQARRPRATNG